MRKTVIAILLMISVVSLCFTEAIAEENLLFGPNWVMKEKGKAVVTPFYFQSEYVEEATYVISVRAMVVRSKVKVVLNGTEVITSKTPFTDGEIEIPITLINGENELLLTIYKGEVDIAVKIITPSATTRTLYCAVVGIDGMLVGEGVDVTVHLLGTKDEPLKGITGIDGFCSFTGLPLEGTVIISVLGDGVEGSEVINLKTSRDHITSTIHIYPQNGVYDNQKIITNMKGDGS